MLQMAHKHKLMYGMVAILVDSAKEYTSGLKCITSNVPSKLCACAHKGHEASAHRKTWSAQKCFFQNVFAHYFSHNMLHTE